MIARRIVYKGQFNKESLSALFDITRKIEITGEVKPKGNQEVILNLEGDPSMIKLLQHQIERKLKTVIQDKTIEPIPYQYYTGIVFLP